MKTTELAELKVAHEAFIDKRRDSGRNVLAFKPACCAVVMETAAPDESGTIWDSLSTCPNCGGLFYKVVTRDGATGTLPQ